MVVETLRVKVERVLRELESQMQAGGAEIELLEVKGGKVKIRMKGECAGCPMPTITPQWGVENFLKKRIPEIIKVEAVY